MKAVSLYFKIFLLCGVCWLGYSCSEDTTPEPEPVSYETKILNLSFNGVEMELPAEIDHMQKTVVAYVLASVDVSKLIPVFEVSDQATVSPKPGVPYNFSSPLTFQIAAPDKTFANYVVEVKKVSAELLSFKVQTQQHALAFKTRNGTIVKKAPHQYTVKAYIHHDDAITQLNTLAEISQGGSIQPDPASVHDYSSPVTFEVSDADGNKNSYEVTVEQLPKQQVQFAPSSEFDDTEGIQFYTSNTGFRYFEDGSLMPFSAYAIKIDMSKGFGFVPFYDTQAGNMKVTQMSAQYETQTGTQPLLAINAGYFGATSSYSLVIDQEVLKASNVPQLSRSDNYYVTRGAIGQDAQGQFDISWVYNIGNNVTYGYPQPAPNVDGETPQPKPTESFPANGFIYDRVNALGGGPVLIKNGTLIDFYGHELFFDDIERSIANRTAIGMTANNELIILVVDGRASYSAGIALKDMARILREQFNCTDALNFDGGGSTTLVVKGALKNQYSIDNGQRNVLTGLLITPPNP